MRHLPSLWSDFDRPFASMMRDLDRPLASWRPMLKRLDDLFSESAGLQPLEAERMTIPACSIDETDEHYVLNFDMPGIEKENIDVELKGNQLAVSGEQKQDKKELEGRTHYAERQYRKFERILTLPIDIKADHIEAEYHNGVLSIAVPKSPEAKRQQIKIGEGKTGFLQKLLGESSKKDKKVIDVKNREPVASH